MMLCAVVLILCGVEGVLVGFAALFLVCLYDLQTLHATLHLYMYVYG
jgi:hypothetical protein